MNFIILTDYYEPIIKSGSVIIGDLTQELINNGHYVTIVTFVDHQQSSFEVVESNNLKIIRIKVFSRLYGRIGRLWAEFRYSSKIRKTLKIIHDIDCDGVICLSPSIFYGSAIKWLKNTYKVQAYLIQRDIFPKWALDSGQLAEGMLYKYFKRVELNLYRSSNIIGIEAKSDLSYFYNYSFDKSKKIEVLNNWGSSEQSINLEFGKKLLDSNKVNIVYGGNMGDAQDLLALINSIDFDILNEKAMFFLIGSGNQFDKIQKVINIKKLSNVVLINAIDKSSYLSVVQNADIGLVSLNGRLLSNNYPLKMIGYMQIGIPILASVNKSNEIINIIRDHDIGMVSLASETGTFNKNLNKMILNQSMRETQGKNANSLFSSKFSVRIAYTQIMRHFS